MMVNPDGTRREIGPDDRHTINPYTLGQLDAQRRARGPRSMTALPTRSGMRPAGSSTTYAARAERAAPAVAMATRDQGVAAAA
jgi:hypothetical protein